MARGLLNISTGTGIFGGSAVGKSILRSLPGFAAALGIVAAGFALDSRVSVPEYKSALVHIADGDRFAYASLVHESGIRGVSYDFQDSEGRQGRGHLSTTQARSLLRQLLMRSGNPASLQGACAAAPLVRVVLTQPSGNRREYQLCSDAGDGLAAALVQKMRVSLSARASRDDRNS